MHPSKRLYILGLLVIFCLLAMTGTSDAQAETSEKSQVYVTVQDFAVLRAGPGKLFQRLTVLPIGTTLRATGRTLEGDWIQVAYEGDLESIAQEDATVDQVTINGVTYGWVAYWLLVWTGDVLELPVDGIPTIRFARPAGPRVTVGPDTYYYVDGVDPSTQVHETVQEPRVVELTGRVGSPNAGFFWLQFEMDGQYYWTASWEVGTPNRYSELPDGAYLYAYGRLLIQLKREIGRNGGILNSITRRWSDLQAGYAVTCNNIPEYAGLRESSFQLSDIEREPIYQPTVTAMLDAIEDINEAIRRFETVCARTGEDRFVRSEEVSEALLFAQEAAREITLARTLLVPLERRDPLLGNN